MHAFLMSAANIAPPFTGRSDAYIAATGCIAGECATLQENASALALMVGPFPSLFSSSGSPLSLVAFC